MAKNSIHFMKKILITGMLALSTLMAGAAQLKLNKGDHVVLIGNTLAERMQHHGWRIQLPTGPPALQRHCQDLAWRAHVPADVSAAAPFALSSEASAAAAQIHLRLQPALEADALHDRHAAGAARRAHPAGVRRRLVGED